MTRTLLLFGAGPGIGNNIAATFASRGPIDHVILLSRNTARLQNEDAPFVRSAAPNAKIDTLTADLSDLDALPNVLAQLDDLTAKSSVEVVYYNPARIQPSSPMLSVDVKEIEEDFRLQVLSLHLITQHFLPLLVDTAKSDPSLKPALLVTNSHLPHDPIPALLSLSLVKGAQRTQVVALNREFAASGVHCGLVLVEGIVDAKHAVLSPSNVAREAWEFWQGGKGAEVRVREV